MSWNRSLVPLFCLLALPSSLSRAQTAPGGELTGGVSLSARLGANPKPASVGLEWRVYQERAEADGSHALITRSSEAAPTIKLPDGDYIVHVSYGLASAMRRVSVRGQVVAQPLTLAAGQLRVNGVLGDNPIPTNRLQMSISAPERTGGEARMLIADAKPGTTIRLPEGAYRITSTYLDKDSAGTTPGVGRGNATNSVVNAEVRVQAGKMTDVTLRHHAAVLTLKLVNSPGGEALANTSFSVLTPGGDVIREMIGAFPSVTLSEGEYVVIARRDGKTFQGTFNVQSTLDRDIEVLTH